MSIDVNVQNDLVIVTESSEDITVNVSNAAGPAGVGVPTGGTTGQVLKKFTNTDYDTYWALDGGGVPYSGATGDVNIGEFQLRAGQVTLDTSPTGTAVVGTTRWNDTIGSSETTLKGGSVILKNGVDLVARVVNKVSPNTTLTKANYQAVRVSGAQGQRLAVAYAQANNDANSADTIGLVCETIPTNQEGFIMTMGQLENINTTGSLQGETWVDGDVLYLSPTTPGAITKVKPTGAGHIVVIGYVEYAHVNNGKIYVKVMNGWELDELHDVDIVTPANNEALIYESSTKLWKNKTIATALGYTPISGSGVTGQVAYWNGTNSQTGSNNLFWDAANSVLGVGTNTPNTASVLHSNKSQNTLTSIFVTNNNAGTAAHVGFRAGLDPSNFATDYISLFILGANFTTSGLLKAKTGVVENFGSNLIISNYNNTEPISFTTGTSRVEKVRIIAASGNVILQNGGTFSDGGQRLQVYGDAFVRGSGNTSATSSLVVQDSASTTLLNVRNDGQIFMQANRAFNSDYIKANGGNLLLEAGGVLHVRLNGGTNATPGGVVIGNANNITLTTGIRNSLTFDDNFTPTSGTSVRNYIFMGFTINQTGGANGITRGLYVNPTLTAAADWRSIEWSNNSGWGLYGAGKAPNLLSGVTLIRTNASSNEVPLLVENYQTLSGFKTVSIDLVAVNGDARITAGNQVFANGGSGFLSFSTRTAEALTEKVRIDSAGRLLIGITSSTFLLDVNGTARVSGNTTINLNQNAVTELLISNTNPSSGANSSVRLLSDVTSGSCTVSKNSGNFTPYKISSPRDFVFYNSTTGGDISLLNDFATGTIKFASGGSSTAQMTLTAAGRLLLGTTTESTFLLDVNGTARVSGSLDIGNNSDQSNYISFRSPSSKLTWFGTQGGVSQFINNSAIGDMYIRANSPSSTQFFWKSIGNLGEAGYRYQFTTGQAIYKDNGTTFTSYASAILSLDSVSRGFLPPRMTTTQKNAIATPAAGLQVYDTTLNQMSYYNGTTWVNF